MNRTGKIFNADVEGICFEDKKGSKIFHFSSVINPNGILASLFDDYGEFKGVILLNPGETSEIVFDGKYKEGKKKKIIFGLINNFDRLGNVKIEYFTGVIGETETIIIIRREEDFKPRKIYLNPGGTQEIIVKIREHNLR